MLIEVGETTIGVALVATDIFFADSDCDWLPTVTGDNKWTVGEDCLTCCMNLVVVVVGKFEINTCDCELSFFCNKNGFTKYRRACTSIRQMCFFYIEHLKSTL